ncbi:MAG TPA: flavodoxin family protein [Firmicutes bacterium]|nr:flavodoxin family protein [Bacillota bacterium]
MKTLILNGSPKRNGDTAALIEEFTKHLKGDVRVVSSYFDNISPCLDCRHCRSTPGCIINDDLQNVYPYLEACDNLVIASPVWFSELSGPLLTLASRIQTYFAARQFRNEPNRIKHKNGILILVGAEKGTEEKASSTAHTILKHMNALPCIASIFSLNTNILPAADDLPALAAARNTALLLNQLLDES